MLIRSKEDKEHIKSEIDRANYGVYVTIKDKPPRRSIRQNDFYWSILTYCSQKGYTKNELNHPLKVRLGHFIEVKAAGRDITIIKSSAELTKEEFNGLLDAAQMLAANLEVKIPLPAHYGLDTDYKNK